MRYIYIASSPGVLSPAIKEECLSNVEVYTVSTDRRARLLV